MVASVTRNTIVVSGDPKGHFIEGTLKTGITPKPGTLLKLQSDGTYDLWSGSADGDRDEMVILCEDWGQGKLPTDAYASGDHFFAYIPVPGDELQVLIHNQTGTADDIAVGGLLIHVNTLGTFIATTGTPQITPFKALESLTDPVADQLLLVRRV